MGVLCLNSVFGYGGRFMPQFATEFGLIGTAVYLAAGVLAVVMMFQIAAAQWNRFAAVERQPDPADFPTFTVDQLEEGAPPHRAEPHDLGGSWDGIARSTTVPASGAPS